MKNWGVIGGVAAALAAGMYVLWGPITERKRRRKGKEGGRAGKTREKRPKSQFRRARGLSGIVGNTPASVVLL